MYLELILIENLEGGRQNMMSSCIKALSPQLKKNYCTQHRGVSVTRKPASQQRNTTKKYHTFDPILAVMKLARSRYLCYTYHAKCIYEKMCSWGLVIVPQIRLYGQIIALFKSRSELHASPHIHIWIGHTSMKFLAKSRSSILPSSTLNSALTLKLSQEQ